MSSPISKDTLDHLAKLARIKLTPEEETRLLDDLKKILEHFEELNELDTKGIPAQAGGTATTNVFREDDASLGTNQGAGVDAFPEREGNFLKVPPVL